MQDSYFNQRHYKPSHQRELEDLQTSGYFKGQVDIHTGNVLGSYYSHWYNTPPKVLFQNLQNIKIQFKNKGPPNQQTGTYAPKHLNLIRESGSNTVSNEQQ